MLKMPPYCRYSVAMGMLSFPFLFARKFSHTFSACVLILPLCHQKPLVCPCLAFPQESRQARETGKYVGKQQWIEYLKQPLLRQPFLSFFPLKLRWKRQILQTVVCCLEGSDLHKAKDYTNDFEPCL